MLARLPLPDEYSTWNHRWGAPAGKRKRVASLLPGDGEATLARFPKLVGPFAYQTNSPTRMFEYPWSYFAIRPRKGMRALEIGGGISGMQFVLAREGVDVTNVDPGQASTGVGWDVDHQTIIRMNRSFGTNVHLISSTLQEAQLPSEQFDIIYSISTLEHISPTEHPSLMSEIARILKPGGRCVLTVDLFLELRPFTDRMTNHYGTNVNIRELQDWSGLSLVEGHRWELFGYPEFDANAILASLDGALFGRYPVCAQCLVLA